MRKTQKIEALIDNILKQCEEKGLTIEETLKLSGYLSARIRKDVAHANSTTTFSTRQANP